VIVNSNASTAAQTRIQFQASGPGNAAIGSTSSGFSTASGITANTLYLQSGATAGGIILQAAAAAGGLSVQTGGTTKHFGVDSNGHVSFPGTAPSVVAGGGCGGSPSIEANSSDISGRVTVGSTTTTCVITFAVAFATYNHCQVTSGSTLAAFAYVYTLSAITISATVLGGDIVDYRCDGV
jgi:hypothetical protein